LATKQVEVVKATTSVERGILLEVYAEESMGR
jgi:hypothetical protein